MKLYLNRIDITNRSLKNKHKNILDAVAFFTSCRLLNDKYEKVILTCEFEMNSLELTVDAIESVLCEGIVCLH